MVQIDFMNKPSKCYLCPFFKRLDNAPAIDEKGEWIKGAYTCAYRCAFAEKYADDQFEKYSNEHEDFLDNASLHTLQDENFMEYIEPWCPIKEVQNDNKR